MTKLLLSASLAAVVLCSPARANELERLTDAIVSLHFQMEADRIERKNDEQFREMMRQMRERLPPLPPPPLPDLHFFERERSSTR